MYLIGTCVWTLTLGFQLVRITGKVIESLGGGTFLAQGVESLLVGYTRPQGGKAWQLMDSILLKLRYRSPFSLQFLCPYVFSHQWKRNKYRFQFSAHSSTSSWSYCQSRMDPVVQVWNLAGFSKGPCIEGLFLQTGATGQWVPCKELGGKRCALGGDSRTTVLSPILCFWAGMRWAATYIICF